MPVHVEIKVNDRVIDRLHIGRLNTLRSTEQVSTYLAVLGGVDDMNVMWSDGQQFEHKYDEGIYVCVQKALEALNDR